MPVVDLDFAVGAFTARAVEPDGKHWAVVGEQLDELVDVKIVVRLALAVSRLGHIPGGEVDAELEAVARRSIGHFAHQVACAALPGGRGHGVSRVRRRPQAEAVVVLARQNYAGHPGAHEGAHPLIDVDVSRVEQGRILMALAPLAVRHRVHSEVYERVHLHFLPLELTVSRPDVGQVVLVDHAYGFHLMADLSTGPAPCRFRKKDSLPLSA